MNRNQNKAYKLLILILIALMLSACKAMPNENTDVLTQKAIQPGKIPVTICVKYSVYLDAFEKAVEQKFPELDLIQVGNYTANYSEEYEQQLANDDLTDIILTWPLDQAAKNCENKLIDLSGMEFTSRYNLSAMNSISQNGKLYYLPGPTQMRGIVYNKTMFEENDWQVPNNFDEFVALCKQIEASGTRSLQLSFWNKEVLRYAFIGFGYTESFSTPAATQKIQEYSIGNGSIRNIAQPAFDTFEQMIDSGIFRPEDLQVRYPMREKMLYNRECAMVSDDMAIFELAKKAGNTDEFAIMPFFSPGSDTGWGHLTPTQFIALNQNLTKRENKEKYDLVLKIMDYISTPEGQLALSNNNTSLISSLVDISEHVYLPELEAMDDIIKQGRYAIFPSFANIDDILYEVLAGMLRGKIDQDDAIQILDNNNRNPKPRQRSAVIGYAEESFSLSQTGAYITDVLRAKANTDFALFLDNGKDGAFNARGISAKLYKGEIRESDITQRVLPVLQHGEAGYLNTINITGENLYNVLEYSLPDGDWFYYVSGLKLVYNPVQAPGSRIISITDESGKSIDKEKLYTVAIMEGSVDEQWIESTITSNHLIKDIIIDDIEHKKNILPLNDNRLKLVLE